MTRAPVIAFALALCACTMGAMHELTLPMSLPDAPAAPAVKGEPLRVGSAVEVPAAVGEIELSRLDWRDDRARLLVRWPDADGLQLKLRAGGKWNPATRVRVLNLVGEPLHLDSWAPATRTEWWSASGAGDALVIEIEPHPGDDARLMLAAAITGTRK